MASKDKKKKAAPKKAAPVRPGKTQVKKKAPKANAPSRRKVPARAKTAVKTKPKPPSRKILRKKIPGKKSAPIKKPKPQAKGPSKKAKPMPIPIPASVPLLPKPPSEAPPQIGTSLIGTSRTEAIAPVEPSIGAPGAPFAGAAKPGPDPDNLPPWEDRQRLKDEIASENISFSLVDPHSPTYRTALGFLPEPSVPHQKREGSIFVYGAYGPEGNLIGAIEACEMEDTLIILRSRAGGQMKRRDMHLLLYSCALTHSRAKNTIYACAKSEVDEELAGLFVLLGRGFGMAAIPIAHSSILFFLRRSGREYDFLISGPELSKMLSPLQAFFGQSMQPTLEALEKTIAVALIPLPLSPDVGEHLRDIKEAVSSLSLPTKDLEPLLDGLRTEYVDNRKDITPETL